MWIISIFDTVNRYRRFRKTLRYVTALDDQALQDVGLKRDELVGAAWTAAFR